MLDQSTKDAIQGAYRQLLSARELTPRYGQRLMIAEIAKTLGSIGPSQDNPPLIVVEAGTGSMRRLVAC